MSEEQLRALAIEVIDLCGDDKNYEVQIERVMDAIRAAVTAS